MQVRKKPMRMCTGCGEMKLKTELIRVVKNKDGEVFLDTTGKAQGRGAYICRDAACLEKARKSRRIEKAFSSKISDEIYDAMQKKLEE